MSSSKSQDGGIGLCGVVFVIFLVLKLMGIGIVATWSWWWVTAPLWVPIVLGLSIALLCCIVLIILEIFKK
jgi:hypothetical protein